MRTSLILASVAILASALVAAQPASSKVDVGGPHGRYSLKKLSKRDLERRVEPPKHGKRSHKPKKSKKAKRSGSCNVPSSSSATAAAQAASNTPLTASSSDTNTSSNSSTGTTSSTPTSAGTVSVDLSSLGVSQFTGTNTGIGSWFRTDNSQDSTDGTSWCWTHYQDSWMGFAPDVATMLGNFGNSNQQAGAAYCGLEAKATNPNNGNTALIYIVDGFDPTWVRTPGSVDLTLAAFQALYGSTTSDKDIVIQNLQWELTGNRMSAYGFNQR